MALNRDLQEFHNYTFEEMVDLIVELRDSNEEMTNKTKELNEEVEWLKSTIDELVANHTTVP